MHTINKVLIGLIVFFGLVFFIFGSAVLQRQNQYRSEAKRLDSNLQSVQRQIDQLQHGNPGQPGIIPQLTNELDLITEGQGNVWYKVAPAQIDAATGTVQITVDSPTPHQLTPEKVVFAFGDRDAGGGYLGEFRITAAAEKQATLTPTGKLTAFELERVQKNPAPWTLYDVMPGDSHGVFEGLSEDQLKSMLPAASLSEYVKDGKGADQNDPPDRVIDGKYVRQLRDYVGEFSEYGRQRSVYLDRVAAEQKDKEYLTNQLQRGEATVAFRDQQIADTKKQLGTLSEETAAVVAHRKELESSLAEVVASIEKLAKDNDRLATKLARWQADALHRINQGSSSASATN